MLRKGSKTLAFLILIECRNYAKKGNANMNIKNFYQLVRMIQMLSDGWQLTKYSYNDGLHVVLGKGNNETAEFTFTTV